MPVTMLVMESPHKFQGTLIFCRDEVEKIADLERALSKSVIIFLAP